MNVQVRYLTVNNKITPIYLCSDGLYHDAEGTIYAFKDSSKSVDKVVRCGVGIFSLPSCDPSTESCRFHDYAYESPAYQAFHTREEADRHLRKLLLQTKGREFLAWPFYILCRIFGSSYWENTKTND